MDETFSSLSRQTFQDFEIIVSDDASIDNSLEICRKWAEKDKRVKIVANVKNLGMTRNWNRALKEAEGDFVVKMDADDIMQARFLEELVHDLESDSKITMACCRTLDCNQVLEPYASYLGDYAFFRQGLDPLKRYVRSGDEWYSMCFSDIQLWCSNAQLHRRKNLLALGGWDIHWGCASDTDLILRVLEQGQYISHNPYCGILYRHRENSVSDTFRKNGWLVMEGILIHLISLSRYHQQGKKISSTLRKAWWRFWRNWQILRREPQYTIDNFPEPHRSNLSAVAGQLAQPPRGVLLEGWLRQKADNIKRSLLR
jgi:alpha-1,3-rhamnosyltransferase